MPITLKIAPENCSRAGREQAEGRQGAGREQAGSRQAVELSPASCPSWPNTKRRLKCTNYPWSRRADEICSSSGRRMKSFYADYKSREELTPSPTPPRPPRLGQSSAPPLLRHFAVHLEICALIWRSETETAATGTAVGQDWDRIGTGRDRRKEIERKAGSQQLATGRR